jgi:hypothetical protein
MGFILTVIYIVLTYLSVAQFFPWLAPYRPLLLLAGAATLTSAVSALSGEQTFRGPQLYLMPGLMFSMGVSRIWMGWYGGAYDMLFEFGFAGIVLYLIALNTSNLKRVRVIINLFILLAFFILIVGFFAYHFGYREDELILDQRWANPEQGIVVTEPRLRWYGFLADPNDLAQNFVIALALLSIRWISQQPLWNSAWVIVPGLMLLYGVFMTHSRGALIALVGLGMFVFKDSLGKAGALVLGAVGFLAALAMNFAGARGFSMGSGSGRARLDIWSDGLGMLKSSPLFGVGFLNFVKHAPQTAHNSFLQPLAELGVFGYFFWLSVVVVTVIELSTLANLKAENEIQHELRRNARVVRLGLVAFLISSWFLSRSYTVTLYLLCGVSMALAEIARRNQIDPLPRGLRHALTVTFVSMIGTVFLVWLMVRSRSLSGI